MQVTISATRMSPSSPESGRGGIPVEPRPRLVAGYAEGVSRELAEQRVLRAATDDVHDVDVAAGQGRGLADLGAVGEHQAVEDRAGDRDRGARDRLPRLLGQRLD